MAERRLLGEGLTFDERLSLAQLVNQPGWKVLVRLMAESCRHSTEEVIRLDPTTDRYPEKVAALQMMARAMNKFSAEVLDSVKLHQRTAVAEAQQREHEQLGDIPTNTRFTGFQMPKVKSPEGQ
jgi:hypothetical protein